MTKQILGKVAYVSRGTYNGSATYEINDVVTYEGSSYVALKDTQGNLPTDENFWQLIAKKGDTYEMTEQDIKDLEDNITNKANSEFNKNYDEKLKSFNDNATSKTDSFNTNASNSLSVYNSNATTKINDFNSNATSKMTAFNNNATQETTDFNTNVSTKQTAYDTNATSKLKTYNDNHTEKLEEYNNNHNTKLADYNQNANDKMDDFDENVENQINHYNNSVIDFETVLDVVTPKQNAKGSEIVIDDALPLPIFETKIEGRSYQNTTNGYQLFDYNKIPTVSQAGATLTNNGDGSFTIGGTGKTTGMFSHYIQLSHDESIKLLHEGDLKMSIPELLTIYPYMSLYNSGGRIFEVNGGMESSSSRAVTREMIEDSSLYIRIGFFAPANVEIPNTTIKFMIYQDGNGTWEPYTGGMASPNINYPQDIEAIEGNVDLTCCGRNLYYSEKDEYIYPQDQSGSWYYLNGIKGASGSDIGERTIFKAKVKKGERYFFNAEVTGPTVTHLVYSDESIITNNINNFTFIADKDDYVLIRMYVPANTEWTVKNVYLSLYDDSHDYESYQETKTTISIPEGEFVGKLNDTAKDNLLIDKNGNISPDKCIFKKVFDGTENWFKSGLSTSSVFVTALEITNLNVNFDYRMYSLSSHFRYNDTSIQKNTFRIYAGSSNDWYIAFCFDINEISTLSDAKTWIANNQLELEYVSNNIETINLGKLEKPIKTFEGVNNIQVLANLDTEVEVKYALDIKKYIDKQNNLQDTQINEINTLLSSTETSAMLLNNYQNDLESEV